MEFKQNIVSVRFVEAFSQLKKLKAFSTQLEASEKLNFNYNSLNAILKGKRDVTIELLRNLFNVYKVNPSFIFDSNLLKEQENKALVPFKLDEGRILVEGKIKKINFLYQRIVDIYVMASSLDFPANFDDINPFAEQRNLAIDNKAYQNMSIEKLVEYLNELEIVIKSIEDFYFKKQKDLFYEIVSQKERDLKGGKKPLKRKK